MAMQSSIQPSSSSGSLKVGSSSTLGGGGRVMTDGYYPKITEIFLEPVAKQDFGRTRGGSWGHPRDARRSGRRSPMPTAQAIEYRGLMSQRGLKRVSPPQA